MSSLTPYDIIQRICTAFMAVVTAIYEGKKLRAAMYMGAHVPDKESK